MALLPPTDPAPPPSPPQEALDEMNVKLMAKQAQLQDIVDKVGGGGGMALAVHWPLFDLMLLYSICPSAWRCCACMEVLCMGVLCMRVLRMHGGVVHGGVAQACAPGPPPPPLRWSDCSYSSSQRRPSLPPCSTRPT